MHRLLGFLEAAPPVADQDTLERLLDGRLDPGSAPPGHDGLARLLAAAAAPAGPEELAGEQLAMATFAAEMRSHPPILSPPRTAVVSKVFTMKAAAAALVAVLSIGGIAAAATGLLPDQASPVAGSARQPSPTRVGRHRPDQLMGRAGSRRLGRTPAGPPGPGCVGPGRPARVATTDAGWTRWRSRPWWMPRAGPMRSPSTVRMWPPAAAQAPAGRVRRRRRASRPLRSPSRHRAAAYPPTRARPPAPAPEGTGRADPRSPPADTSSTARSGPAFSRSFSRANSGR
jgi:hypothetical protein